MRSSLVSALAFVVGLPLFAACGGADTEESAQSDDLTTVPSDAGAGEAAVGDGGSDGTPTRRACTSSFGSGLTTGSYGRLDGYLVSIVQPGGHSCSSDNGHVHLQILMNGSVYDVAANVNVVDFAEVDHALVGGPWSEGWHSDAKLDYASSLGLHTNMFSAPNQAQLTAEVNAALATANHVSVYATKYAKSGIHLVHRNGRNNDGAIVLDPLGANPHYLTFHFPDQSSF